MQANTFNTHFLNQFHQESIVYPGKKEKQYHDILFRQFAGKNSEIAGLAKSISQRLDDSQIITQMIHQVEEEDISDYFRLSNVAHKLTRQVSSYVMNAQLNTKHSEQLLRILKPFIRLIDNFHENTQLLLLKRLKNIRSTGKTQVKITSMDRIKTDDLITGLAQFAEELGHYHSGFDSCIDKNSDGFKGVAVTTYMEEYVINVVSLIEKLISDTKSLQTLLQKWKVRVANRQLQVIYN